MASIRHLSHSHFDHYLLLVNILSTDSQTCENGFKSEDWWTLELSFMEEVEQSWHQNSGDIFMKFTSLRDGLSNWAKCLKHERVVRKK